MYILAGYYNICGVIFSINLFITVLLYIYISIDVII